MRYTRTLYFRRAISGEGEDTTTLNPPGDKTFTKADIDKAVEKERVEARKQAEALSTRLTKLQEEGLSPEAKTKLQEEITTLKQMHLSAEERIKAETSKLQTKYDTDLKTAQKEGEFWRNRYSEYRTEAELFRAASTGKASRPKQVVDLLVSKTKIVEKKDDAGKVVDYVPMVTLDHQGKALTFTPEDAVKHMRDQIDDYGNLFVGEGKGGAGLLNNGDQSSKIGELTPEEAAKLPDAKYQEWRQKHIYGPGKTSVVTSSSSS